ncbi:Polyprotein [Phytophthora palmivora]|uniref:Polyprotein n=1 Tax=Phytophthora palmivora TaxID=4796 RepID=A0A2P4XDX0_9STRA|nr:Polyprotein [Phytophthora palmivora]
MSEGQVAARRYGYRGITGSLQYFFRGTGLGIFDAVRELSNLLTRYNRTHWDAARQVLKHLTGTSTYGLSKQGGVSFSTVEAELFALSEGTKESELLWYLLCEMGFSQKMPGQVRCDSNAAVTGSHEHLA